MIDKINIPEFEVSEFNQAFKEVIESNFNYVRIKGEISEVKTATRGQIYLTLKDEDSILSGVIWDQKKKYLDINPEIGLEIIATGRITTWSRYKTTYQIDIDKIEIAGEGALLKLIEERKKRLQKKGYFDEDKKIPLPFLPERLGIITSPTGSVVHDIINRVNDRFPMPLDIWPVSVQGVDAADSIINAIEGFNKLKSSKPDVLIIARGGGSTEDLMAFNDENLSTSVFDSKIPIISAIGHETDNTLIDLVADLRAPTPTAAAEKSVPVKNDLIDVIGDLESRFKNSILRSIQYRETQSKKIFKSFPEITNILKNPFQKIDNLSSRLIFSLKSSVNIFDEKYLSISKTLKLSLLNDKLIRLDERAFSNYKSLGTKFSYYLKNFKNRLNLSSGILSALSHEKVLNRGFAIVKDDNFSLIRSSKDVKNNQSLNIQFSNNDVLIANASLKNKE